MKLFLLLLAAVHPGGTSSDWASVNGAGSVRFRWSRPASNSCLVELQNNDALNAIRISAVATYAANRVEAPVVPPGQNLGRVGPTLVRERKEEQRISAPMGKMATYLVPIPNCYRIDTIRGTSTPVNGALNRDTPGLPPQRNGENTGTPK